MKIEVFATVALATGLANAAAVLKPRAIVCGDMIATINAAPQGPAKAKAYCTAYLGLVPKTTITTRTAWKTKKQTDRTTTTTTSLVTPPDAVQVKKTTTTTATTRTPADITDTEYITSTAYLDNDGNTLALLKRGAVPTELPDLMKRATKAAKPAFFNGLSKADLRAACLCLNIVPTTVVRTQKATATTTTTKHTSYTIKKVRVVDPGVTLTTTTATRVLTYVAPAPVVPTTSVIIEQVAGCPPGMDSTFECPEGTGADDMSGTAGGYLSCPVVADDGYWGSCNYWDDDGSPVGSSLQIDTGDDNSANRDATYGDEDTDDCPSWSDFSCTSTGGGRKRWFQENKLSPRSTGTTLTRKLKKMPAGLKRGGHRKYH